MILEGLAGPAMFLASLIFMFLIVPLERIRELVLIGLVGGLGIALVLIYLMQNVFGLWVFERVDLVTVLGVPFFLAAAWIPLVIAFSHLLAQYRNISMVLFVLVAFPLGAVIVHYVLIANMMLVYSNWNLSLTFLVALGLHLAIIAYLYLTGRLENFRALTRT